MKNCYPSTHSRPLAALALLLAASAAQAQTPASFGVVSTYSVGANSNPRSVAVADVNGDGRPDIVTANYNNDRVGVLLSQVGGGFAAVATYSTGSGSQPQGIAVADVNGDGRPDIVTTIPFSDAAGVLLAQVGGGFAAVATYSTGSGSQPQGIAVADVNRDGWPDIVTANGGSSTAGVLLRQAGGGFAPVSTYSIGPNNSNPKSVVVADVNRDGRPDIVTANSNTGRAGVLLGLAGGGFAAVSTYPTGAGSLPPSVAVADVNSDGRPDIVTANGGNTNVGVLLGQAGGGFAAASTYGVNYPQSVAVADLNGDGQPDIVTAVPFFDAAGVLLGQVGGGFAMVRNYSTGVDSGPRSVAVADVNGDGRPDIVTANSFNNTVGVLLNTGTFTPLAAAPAAQAADVALFPNPAHDGFAVQLPAAWGAAHVQVELRNSLGQVVSTHTAALAGGAALPFATDGLAPGVYVLRVQAGAHTAVRRVVVE